jgi:hypothetical protein
VKCEMHCALHDPHERRKIRQGEKSYKGDLQSWRARRSRGYASRIRRRIVQSRTRLFSHGIDALDII